MMKHPDAMSGFLVRGSANIDAMLAKGWTIVECERNALLPHRTAVDEPCRDAVADLAMQDAMQATGQVTMQATDKPKRGRPRKASKP
jgi:hypothetical protein